MAVAPGFRFGVTVSGAGSSDAFLDRVREADAAGVDVVMVPDHLGSIGPVPALVAAAERAPRLHVGTNVLNASFYNPTLLARDLLTVHRLSGGRLEIGLGAGSVAAEFEAAGMDFPPAGRRVEHLAATVRQLRTAFAGDEHPPPITIGGSGNRVLSLAAREADGIAFAMLPDEEALADRVALVRERAGDRWDGLTLSLSLFDLGIDREPNVDVLRFARPNASDDELRRSPSLVAGSLEEVAAHLLGLRETYGITAFTLSQPSPEVLDNFARVITRIRELGDTDRAHD